MRNDPLDRVDPSGEIDFLVWYNAVYQRGTPSIYYGPIGGCSTSFDYQPYAYLNIFLGSEIYRTGQNNLGQNSEEAWNGAPAEMIRGLHLAIRGYQNLVGPAFGSRMGQAGKGGMVIVLYGEPWVGSSSLMAYLYPPGANENIGQILIGENRLNERTPIGDIVGTNTRKAAGGFAHEFTHMLAQQILPDEDGVYVEPNYCENVGGYIEGGRWNQFTTGAPIHPDENICPPGPDPDCLPEAVANTVGLYIATGGSVPPGVNMPNTAIDWIEGYYRDRVMGK